MEEILGVRRVFFRRFVALRHADQLQKAEPIGIRIAAALGHPVPVKIAETVGILRAVIAQVTKAVVAVDDEIDRGGAAGAGNPDRRMRLLDRPRPQVHHRQLIVLAVPGKNFLGAPGFLHQRQRLAVTLALLDRHDAVGDRRVGRQSGRKARHQTAAADAVDHGVFLGDPRRRAGRGQGRAELHDRDVHAVGGARQHRAHQARIGHETVDVLVVLVGAHPVHAGARRVDEFVERPVVILAHLLRIGDVEPDRIDVGGLVMLVEIRRQIAIRHQVEHADFHGGSLQSQLAERWFALRSIHPT